MLDALHLALMLVQQRNRLDEAQVLRVVAPRARLVVAEAQLVGVGVHDVQGFDAGLDETRIARAPVRVAPRQQLAGLDQAAHAALGHLQAVACAGPAGDGQVGAAQVAVRGDRAQHRQAVGRRALARRGLFGFGGRRPQQAGQGIGGQSHGSTPRIGCDV
ncbi:hypothetical protein [Delftia sp. PS-11]|uniref:hypothetical protein n=1 Tax=Delftia sp. PS-11 TaxID=2767222 RepID=UPI003AB7C828